MKILGVQEKMWSLRVIRIFFSAVWALPTNFFILIDFDPDHMPDRSAWPVKPQKIVFRLAKGAKWGHWAKNSRFELFSSFMIQINHFSGLEWRWNQWKSSIFCKYYKNQALYPGYQWFQANKWGEIDDFRPFLTIFAIDFRGLSVKLRFLKIAEKGKNDRKMGKFFQIKPCKKIFDFLIENSVEL